MASPAGDWYKEKNRDAETFLKKAVKQGCGDIPEKKAVKQGASILVSQPFCCDTG